MAERTRVIGVRGAYTAFVLDDLGVTNVEVTGCPSFYATRSAPLRVRKKRFADVRRIAVNGTSNVVGHSFDRGRARQARAPGFRLTSTSMNSARMPRSSRS